MVRNIMSVGMSLNAGVSIGDTSSIFEFMNNPENFEPELSEIKETLHKDKSKSSVKIDVKSIVKPKTSKQAIMNKFSLNKNIKKASEVKDESLYNNQFIEDTDLMEDTLDDFDFNLDINNSTKEEVCKTNNEDSITKEIANNTEITTDIELSKTNEELEDSIIENTLRLYSEDNDTNDDNYDEDEITDEDLESLIDDLEESSDNLESFLDDLGESDCDLEDLEESEYELDDSDKEISQSNIESEEIEEDIDDSDSYEESIEGLVDDLEEDITEDLVDITEEDEDNFIDELEEDELDSLIEENTIETDYTSKDIDTEDLDTEDLDTEDLDTEDLADFETEEDLEIEEAIQKDKDSYDSLLNEQTNANSELPKNSKEIKSDNDTNKKVAELELELKRIENENLKEKIRLLEEKQELELKLARLSQSKSTINNINNDYIEFRVEQEKKKQEQIERQKELEKQKEKQEQEKKQKELIKRYKAYSEMNTEVLYDKVKKFMITQGVKKQHISLSLLNDTFGVENIKKLSTKHYIIKTSKGVTIGR